MSDEDTEQPQRRRSARIIALEEKKEQERKALAEARKNNPENNNNKGDKGKGKAIVGEEDYDFIDDSDDEDDNDEQYAPTKKRGRKSKPLHQLISSTQPLQGGQNPENRSTSRKNGSPKIPDKHVLEFVLDLLQRKDPEELFAEPVNLDEDYYRIVKEPMDFATMRAKLHENMYTNMEQFKRDVYLICSNAMNVNPASTIYHKVVGPNVEAEAINEHATKVFHGLSADPEHFDMEFCLNKKRRGRKPLGRPRNADRPRQLPPKPGGGNFGANATHAELEKRQMYWPSSGNSLLSEVMNGPKHNLQFNKPASYYQDSLVRFVQDMGPAAQTSAAKKLETLQFNQILCGETTRPNPLANFLDTIENTTITLEPSSLEPPPQTTTKPDHDSPNNMDYPLLSNRPLAIPGFAPPAPQETTNINLDSSGDYKGKKVLRVEEGWDACTAALLGGVFINKGGGTSRGLNLKGEGESSSYKMASSFHENLSSSLIRSSSFLEANNNNDQNQGMQGMQWNTPLGTSNLIDNFMNGTSNTARDVTTSGSSRVRSQVWPTRVISGPQSKPLLEPISTSDGQLAELCLLGQPRTPAECPLSDYNLFGPSLLSHQQKPEEEPMIGSNISGHSLLSQPKPADQTMTDYNYTSSGQSHSSQQKPAEPVIGNNLSWQSFMPQQKPAEPVTEYILSWQSFMPQLKLEEPMTGYNLSGQSRLSQQNPSDPMNGYNLTGQSFLSQEKPTEPLIGYNLSGQSFLPQHKSEDEGPMIGYPLSGQSFVSQEKPIESMTCYNLSGQSFMSRQKPKDAKPMTRYNLSQASKWIKEDNFNSYNLNNTYQLDEFQTISGSINFNNISLPDHVNLYTPPPAMYGYFDDLPMQLEPKPEPNQLNPLGLFPHQLPKPSSSSAALEIPMWLDAMNYYGGNAMEGRPAGGGESTSTAQLIWDDDHQPNLALQL